MQRSAEVATASISSHSFLIQEHFLASTRMRRLSLLPPGISAKIPVSFLSKGISVISPPLSRPPITKRFRASSLIWGSPLTRSDIRTEGRSEEHTSELQSRGHLVCRLLLEKKQ